jgi:hypothetical protein
MECAKIGCLMKKIRGMRVCSRHRRWNNINFNIRLCEKPGCKQSINNDMDVCQYHKDYVYIEEEICDMPRCSYKKKLNMTVCGYHKRYNNIGKHILSYMIKRIRIINPCCLCGDEMGPQNPRQLCGKTHCYNDY